VKKSRKIAEGLLNEMIKAETVIILDFEGAQRTSIFSMKQTNWLSWFFKSANNSGFQTLLLLSYEWRIYF